MKKLSSFAVISFCISLFSGCTSIMVFQGAKTVPKGIIETGVGAAGGIYKGRYTIPKFDLSVPSVAGNAWVRYGILPSLDAGINVAIPGSITTDAKYMFMDEKNGAPFTASAGLAYAFSLANNDNTSNEVQRLTDYIVPVYFSRDFSNDSLTLYLSPRYFYRRIYNEIRHDNAPSETETLYDNMWGLGMGVMFNISKKNRILVECQHTAPFNNSSVDSVQCGAGFATRWGYGND